MTTFKTLSATQTDNVVQVAEPRLERRPARGIRRIVRNYFGAASFVVALPCGATALAFSAGLLG